MVSTRAFGRQGEDVACSYLESNGYSILEKNWYFKHKEIDIIARDGDEIAIIEVKTREGSPYQSPLESVTASKIRNIVTAAEEWLQINNIEMEARFDIITIVYSDADKFELVHLKSAFTPSVE